MQDPRNSLSVFTKLSFYCSSTIRLNGGSQTFWNRRAWVSLSLFARRIVSDMDVDVGELRRTLQSLACGKKKVLKKIPPGRDVNTEDVFRFNADFEDPRAKVHINSIQAKVTVRLSLITTIPIFMCLCH